VKRVLNLYAGLGGNRKLWDNVEVTAVEMNPKISAVYRRLNPDDFVIDGDAHQYLLDHFQEFDFIWSSPPCQSHSRMVKFTRHSKKGYPDFRLYEEIIFLKNFFKGRWVVENVIPYYDPLIQPSQKIDRHLYWSNFEISDFTVGTVPNFINRCNLEGKKAMMDWLGIHYDENIYYGKNHCPSQILRNCVHPKIGLHIMEESLKWNQK